MIKADQILLQKLNDFIRKYYQNKLLKGVIYGIGIFVSTFLLVALLEYYGRYTTNVRMGLFFFLLATALFLLVWYILIPLGKLFKLGSTLNHEQAAQIIGDHFSEVGDKLLNTLQLLNQRSADSSLLEAAIDQKSSELRVLPFDAAIETRKNYTYLRYAAIPVVLVIALLIVAPAVVSESTERLVNYDIAYKTPAPFNFTIENKSLVAEQYKDFELKVVMDGEKLPNEVSIHYGGLQYKLTKEDATHFSYTFKNIQKTTDFFLEALGFEDAGKQLKVIRKPVLLNYVVKLQYPRYLGLKDEVLNNPADLNIPAGTLVNWQFTGKETNEIQLLFSKLKVSAESKDQINYKYARKFFLSDEYAIVLSNTETNKGDSMHFLITVQPDAFPSVIAEQRIDSNTGKYVYLAGTANDDNGLSKLTFNYRFTKASDKTKVDKGQVAKEIAIPTDKRVSINHIFDLYEIGFSTADEIEYYFEVWDNDGVNGAKSSKSEMFTIKAPDKQQLREQTDAASEALEKKMEDALKDAKELQKELDQLQQKLKSQQPLTWEEKKRLEQVSEKQKELQQKMQELQKDFKQKNQKEQSFKEEQERILEKQMELQKMYEQLMTDEMKQLMKQLEQMMKMQNKDLIKKEMEKLELNNKDVEKELDRMLEMYKELEVDKRMEDAMKDLKELEEKQRNLSKEQQNKENTNQQTPEQKQQAQEEIKKEFNQIQKDLKELEKKNSELENPKQLADTKELEKQIEEKMDKGAKDLGKGNDKKAEESQEEAADKLKEMEEKMQEQKEKDEAEQDEIDIQALREILENLIQLSKDQERVMEDLKQINGYNPKFVELAKEQKIIKDNAKMVEDSLVSLSKRAPEVKSFINKEVTKMNNHLERSNESFSLRNIGEARVQQQYAMTRMNNLAVMLSESLKQMQQKQMQPKGKSGKGKPKSKPGGSSSKPSMSQLKKMQEEMNKQMKDGMNKNGSGEKGKGQMSSEQFARMAAQQMAIRQQMQKMMSEMDAQEKEKMGGGKQLGDLQKMMEETEKDLVNKRLTQETLMRQQEILTRLLEHEKAEKKQEQEEKREAEQGKEKPRPSPEYLDKLNQKQKRESELLQTVPAEMQPYYKQKAKEYLEKAG